MPVTPIGTGFRRRLTTTFVLVAFVSGGILAVTSFVLIREYRTRAFVEQAMENASLSLISAPENPTVADFEGLLSEFQRRGGFETVVTEGDVVFASVPELGLDDLPDGLAADVRPGTLTRRSAVVRGEPGLVIGGATASGATQLYFFFSRAELIDSIDGFRNVLLIGWVLVIVAAALFGDRVARRTLRPVNQAAEASQSLAEGLLDTRLDAQSDDEFGRWAASFNTMAEALESKIADLSDAAERERRFTANVAHELRTPLTGMVTAGSLLDEGADSLPPDVRRSAQLLVDDVRRLQSLVTELLTLARFDAGQEQARVEPLRLVDALRTVTRSWDGTSSIDVEIDEDVVVMADRARFRLVVSNLLRNAVEHAEETVELHGHRNGDAVVIEVLDRGPGIDDEHLRKVFDRFFKGDPSRSTGGSGLGLSIALENARLQGGSLSAHNREGGGMCFAFVLPAGLVHADDGAAPVAG